MLISDHAKDFVKYCLEGGGPMSPFQPLVYMKDFKDCVSRKKFIFDDLCGESERFS